MARSVRLLVLGGAVVAGAAIAAAAAPHPPYRDGAPPGFSGGFGEASCDACHFSAEPNDGVGTLRMEGAGEAFVPGRSYPITITLTRPEMVAAGFQLTARFSDGGSQAGTLSADSSSTPRTAVATDRGIQYAYQLLAGSAPAAGDTASWVVRWTAPAAGEAVTFHLAANAADGDGSASGDYVYTATASARPVDAKKR